MPQVIYTEQNDEITDLVDRVRNAPDPHVALVLGAGASGLQTPLNVRLLRQLGARAGKTVSIISGDPYIQELSRVGGLPTYASVPAFERGIQTVRAHPDEGEAGAGGAGPVGLEAGAAGMAGVAMPQAPPAPPRSPHAPVRVPGAAERRLARRRPLYFVAAGLVVLGLILFLVVAPSAKVTITLAGTPLTVTPTIQGSPDPGNAGQADHIVTAVVTSNQSSQFTATPTGMKAVPAAPASTTVHFRTTVPLGVDFTLPANTQLHTGDGAFTFLVTTTAVICIGPNDTQPSACQAGEQPNANATVHDQTAQAKGNTVSPNAINKWTHGDGNPCDPNTPGMNDPFCSGGTITVANPASPTGGADATTEVVASATDVTSFSTQADQTKQQVTNAVNQDMQSKAGGKIIAKDPGGNGITLVCTITPALPAANAVFAATQITVACAGKAAAYSSSDVLTDAKADLQQQVPQGDTLATDAINCNKPSVTQAADDGTVVLSVQCTSFSKQSVDLEGLKGQLSGKSASDARNLIEHRFNHVKDVSISQSPPLFWLPLFSGRIEIDESFVAQTGT